MISPEARAVLDSLAESLEGITAPFSLNGELRALHTMLAAFTILNQLSTAEMADSAVLRFRRALDHIDKLRGQA